LALGLLDAGFNGTVGAWTVVENSTQNFANVVAAVPALALPVLLPVVAPAISGINASTATAQAVVDAVGAGDLEGVASALINAPATLTGAVLNGYGTLPLLGTRRGDFLVLWAPFLLSPPALLPDCWIYVTKSRTRSIPSQRRRRRLLHRCPRWAAARPSRSRAADPAQRTFAVDVPKADATTAAEEEGQAGDEADGVTANKDDDTNAVGKASADSADTGTASTTGTKKATTDSPTTGGRHRAQSDNPVSSTIKKIRDQVKKAPEPKKEAAAAASESK
jgi:hypothetical protein